MGGHGRLPGGGGVWVGGGDKTAGGARHGSEKEQELPPQDWREMSLHLPFRVNKEEGVTLSGNSRGTTRVPKTSLACQGT